MEFILIVKTLVNLSNVATIDFIEKEKKICIGYNCCDDTGELAVEYFDFSKQPANYEKIKKKIYTVCAVNVDF